MKPHRINRQLFWQWTSIHDSLSFSLSQYNNISLFVFLFCCWCCCLFLLFLFLFFHIVPRHRRPNHSRRIQTNPPAPIVNKSLPGTYKFIEYKGRVDRDKLKKKHVWLRWSVARERLIRAMCLFLNPKTEITTLFYWLPSVRCTIKALRHWRQLGFGKHLMSTLCTLLMTLTSYSDNYKYWRKTTTNIDISALLSAILTTYICNHFLPINYGSITYIQITKQHDGSKQKQRLL